MLRREMRKEFITEEELMAKVRESGMSDLSRVKAMYLEADGEISIIKRDDDDIQPPNTRAARQ